MTRRLPHRKSFLALAIAGASVPSLAFRAAAADPYTLRLGITTSAAGEYYAICTQFAEEVARRSGGRLSMAGTGK